MVYLILIQNLALLVALSVVHQFILRRFQANSFRFGIVSGLIFGAVGVVGMMTPVHFVPGVIFDGRSVVLAVSGMFGGPVVAVIAALVCGAYRIWLGGGGALVGVSVIAMAAGLGTAYYYLRQKHERLNGLLPTWGVGLLVHILMLILFLGLPGRVGFDVIRQIGLPILLAYPVATMLLFQFFRSIEESTLAGIMLGASERRYRHLFETMGEGLVTIDVGDAAVFSLANPAAERLFGVAPNGLAGRSLADFCDATGLKLLHEQLALRANGQVSTYEIPLIRDDGARRIVQVTGSPRYDDVGEYLGSFSLLVDITDRKQAEEALRESEMRHRGLIENLPQRIFQKDRNLVYVTCNKRFAQDLGIEPEEIIGRTDFDFFPQELAEKYRADDQRVMESGSTEEIEEVYIQNDVERIIQTVKVALTDDEGKVSGILGIFRDITDRKREEAERVQLEARLRQSQKLEAVGQLAGGIAHDFNNILFAILGYADLAATSIQNDCEAKQYVQEIKVASHRAAELVRQILTFARKSEKAPVQLQVSAILTETLTLLRATLPTTIQISQQVNARNTTVTADPIEIHQVIMNLCTNAGQAMQVTGGELRVTLDETVVGEVDFQHEALVAGSYLVLSVSDTGPGIPAGVRERIFEPFFTTKQVGEGTGMGLSVVHGIVKELGGTINVYREPQVGTVFKVFLPLSGMDSDCPDSAGVPIPGGTERVLVVDDEPALSELVAKMVRSLGYTVTRYTSSRSALESYLATPEQFDIIITDQTMPELTGGDLATAILTEHPDQPIILCTGFSPTMSGEIAEGIGIAAYLIKPITLHDLALTLREVLDRKKLSGA